MAAFVALTSRQFNLFFRNSAKFIRSSSATFHCLSNNEFQSNQTPRWKRSCTAAPASRQIQTQDTPNPNSIKLLVSRVLLQQGTMDFPNVKAASKSPLAKKLFDINGVTGVYFGHDFLTVTKENEELNWQKIKPEILAVVTEFLSSGQPLVDDDVTVNAPESSDEKEDETVTLIKELIETRIRPTIQEDGGDIVFQGFEEGVVKVKLQGSCTSCPSSTVTLKRGVQNMLQFYVPEVMGVIQVEDEVDDISKQEFEKFEKSLEENKSST